MTDSTKPTSMRYRREVNVANNTLASILERYNGIFEQVLQRVDILEQGQKLDRKVIAGLETSDAATRSQLIQRIDILETAQSRMVHGMKVDNVDSRLGTQMLEVIQDNGSVNDAIQEMGREAARDVIDSFDFEHHHVERAVHECIENMDLSEHFDEENIDVRRMDLDTLADFLVDERPLRIPLRQIEDHEDRLDALGDQMCTVITHLETIGIHLAPENNRKLYGDKRDEAQKFGDTLAHIAKSLTPDDRQTIIELADGLVTRNKEASSDEEE